MDKLKKVKLNKLLFLSFTLYFLVFTAFSYFSYKRLGAFGCFDDCFNYVGGYLILKGKIIYTDFFFNHALVMPYLSFFIQKFLHPTSIYTLILYHRLLLIGFSFLMGTFLIARFRIPVAIALIIYESTKFYVFGDRFLGEAFVVYPLLYLFLLALGKLKGERIYKWDMLLSAVLTWFCLFSREPYTITALLLFGIQLYGKENLRIKTVSVLILAFLTILVFAKIPFSDFYRNVFEYNRLRAANEFGNSKLFGIPYIEFFLYPLKVFTLGFSGTFKQIEIILASIFALSGATYLLKINKKIVLLIILILGLSNTRPVDPGVPYYQAFHMNVWYALFICSIAFFVYELYKKKTLRKIAFFLILGLILVPTLIISSPLSPLRAHVNSSEEFNTGYGNYYAVGQSVKLLSSPSDTFFADGYDELLIWQSGLLSPYKYTWYTSFMPLLPLYSRERSKMFRENPPDFYYGSCTGKNIPNETLTKEEKKLYQRVYFSNKPSCLFVLKRKIKEITKNQWINAGKLGYHLP